MQSLLMELVKQIKSHDLCLRTIGLVSIIKIFHIVNFSKKKFFKKNTNVSLFIKNLKYNSNMYDFFKINFSDYMLI